MFDKIRKWSEDRNIPEGSDIKNQTLKLGEEYGELLRAVIKGDEGALIDAVGDMVVVLTIISQLSESFTIEEAIESAYDEIKDRKGKMVNGTFIKE